jgi:hypothetical protein
MSRGMIRPAAATGNPCFRIFYKSYLPHIQPFAVSVPTWNAIEPFIGLAFQIEFFYRDLAAVNFKRCEYTAFFEYVLTVRILFVDDFPALFG